MKRLSIHISIALGLVLAMALLRLLGRSSSVMQAQGPDGYSIYYVAPGGICGGMSPCYDNVHAAVDAADDPDDVIKVASGTYTGVTSHGDLAQVVYISKTLTIQGGYTTTNWSTPDPEAHPTTLDAQGLGGVLTIVGDISPTIEGLCITGGVGARPVDECGGGVSISDAAVSFRNNQVFSNSASYSGGGVCAWNSNATLNGNAIYSNTAIWGGGLALNYGAPALEDNDILSNTASSGGGGLALYYSNATLSRNTIASNGGSSGLYATGGRIVLTGNVVSANAGRGVKVGDEGGATLNDNIISSNRGGGVLTLGPVHLSGNTIVSNTATRGGALLVSGFATSINDVFADNRANRGSGIYIGGSHKFLMRHATLARNTGSAGLYTEGDVEMTNTILVSHTTGICVQSWATAQLEATLWGSGAWANDRDWSGSGTILTGTINLWGDPDFVDPDAGDYHITRDSAAIDAGMNAGVIVDIDGGRRPFGAGYDIGADEFRLNEAPDMPSSPVPADGATRVPITERLSWEGGDPDGDPVTYTVAFGSSDPPLIVGTTTLTQYTPSLVGGTTYYWAITASDGMSTTAGLTWSFTTARYIYLPLVLNNSG